MSRKFSIEVEVIDAPQAPDGWMVILTYDRDKPSGVPTRKTILENGMIRRIEEATRAYIDLMQNGAVQ